MKDLEKITNQNVHTEMRQIKRVSDNFMTLENENALISVTQSFTSVMFNEVTESVKLMDIYAKLENIIDSFAQSFYTLEHILNKLKLNLLLKQNISCPLLPAIKTQCIDVFKSHIRVKNES